MIFIFLSSKNHSVQCGIGQESSYLNGHQFFIFMIIHQLCHHDQPQHHDQLHLHDRLHCLDQVHVHAPECDDDQEGFVDLGVVTEAFNLQDMFLNVYHLWIVMYRDRHKRLSGEQFTVGSSQKNLIKKIELTAFRVQTWQIRVEIKRGLRPGLGRMRGLGAKFLFWKCVWFLKDFFFGKELGLI